MSKRRKKIVWGAVTGIIWLSAWIYLASLTGCSSPSGNTVEFRPVGYSQMDTNKP